MTSQWLSLNRMTRRWAKLCLLIRFGRKLISFPALRPVISAGREYRAIYIVHAKRFRLLRHRIIFDYLFDLIPVSTPPLLSASWAHNSAFSVSSSSRRFANFTRHAQASSSSKSHLLQRHPPMHISAARFICSLVYDIVSSFPVAHPNGYATDCVCYSLSSMNL